MTDYKTFLSSKAQFGQDSGFEAIWIPDFLFDFQKSLLNFSLRKGRAAIFADCGLGKTPIELSWAENVHRKTNRPVLILTPLAVAHQFVREGKKFGIEVIRSDKSGAPITVTNYERLHYFNPNDFAGVVCDESSILKNFSGTTRKAITEFLRTIPYRLLATATAAPNDYIEFGTSSEALGEMGYMDMLARFFKHDTGSSHPNHGMFSRGNWRFRGYSETDFWRWICSWARAIRKPSDMGFPDRDFMLPQMSTTQHVVSARIKAEGMLLDLPAMSLEEQRDERRRTITERCEKVAELLSGYKKPVVVWCNLNDEGDLLEKLILGAVQVSGQDSDSHKEESFEAFESGEIQVLVTKPTIAGFGLNWQHCSRQTFFPSHSFEQWYQATRRSWRFGQKNLVEIDIVTSESESRIVANLQRKMDQALKMFDRLIKLMNDSLAIERENQMITREKIPSWLANSKTKPTTTRSIAAIAAR